MFGKFIEDVAKASGQVAQGVGSRIEAAVRRDVDRAVDRAAKQVEREAVYRSEKLFLGLFAPVPVEAEPTSTGSALGRGLFAPPDDT